MPPWTALGDDGFDDGLQARTRQARTRSPTMAGDLTEAELKVAALAAQGHTNQQIAGMLFITVSTVEQHLTRVYRKLRVNRRADLRQRLGGAAADTCTARAG